MAELTQGRKHLAGDIVPYTCVLPNCATPEVLFPAKDTWRRHLFEEHYSYEYWTCSLCHEGTEFPDEESFVAHTKTWHASSINQDRIAVLASVSRRSAPVELKSCPICDWPQSEGATADKENLFEHVAKEVHAFSLRSLPWADKLENEAVTWGGGSPENVINWLWGNESSENLKPSRLELTEPAGRSLGEPVTSSTGYFQHQDNPYFAGSSSPSSTGRTSMAFLDRGTERHGETLRGPLSFESNPSSPCERSQSDQQSPTPPRLEEDSVSIHLSPQGSSNAVPVFSSSAQPMKRGRSNPLPGEKRARVSNMRKIRACIRCRIRKREVRQRQVCPPRIFYLLLTLV